MLGMKRLEKDIVGLQRSGPKKEIPEATLWVTLRTTAVQENHGNSCVAPSSGAFGAFCPGQGLGSGDLNVAFSIVRTFPGN